MSSPSSRLEIYRRVDDAIHEVLAKYPTLRLSTSAVANTLGIPGKEVQNVLFLEVEKGALLPIMERRCEECDSVPRSPIPEKNDTHYCYHCKDIKSFERILLFQATSDLLNHLHFSEGEIDPKKD